MRRATRRARRPASAARRGRSGTARTRRPRSPRPAPVGRDMRGGYAALPCMPPCNRAAVPSGTTIRAKGAGLADPGVVREVDGRQRPVDDRDVHRPRPCPSGRRRVAAGRRTCRPAARRARLPARRARPWRPRCPGRPGSMTFAPATGRGAQAGSGGDFDRTRRAGSGGDREAGPGRGRRGWHAALAQAATVRIRAATNDQGSAVGAHGPRDDLPQVPVPVAAAHAMLARNSLIAFGDMMHPRSGLDYGRFEALTFDCYGTLIDWEAGLADAFRPILRGPRGRAGGRGRAHAVRRIRGRRRGRAIPDATGTCSPRACAGSPASSASSRRPRRRRPSPARSSTGRRSRIRRRHWRGSSRDSGSA